MSQNKDFSLSMSGDAFSSLRSDFDQVLQSTIAGMIETEQDSAEISIKVKIGLSEDSAPDFSVSGGQQTREVTKPKFEHTVQAVIQRKEKKTGSFSGNNELVWDRQAGKYVWRPIEDGQRTLFDDEEPEHVDIGGQEGGEENGPKALPEGAEEAEVVEGDDTQGDTEDAVPGDAGEYEEEMMDPAHDPSKPFGWLRQFIGVTMHVSEAMGNYSVRTAENKVVLSSATSPENPFYCPAEKLAAHVGHTLVCVGYGEDEIVNISIECEDCNEVLYDMDVPTPEPVEDEDDPEEADDAEEPADEEAETGEEPPIEGGDSADGQGDGESPYPYDAPEE